MSKTGWSVGDTLMIHGVAVTVCSEAEAEGSSMLLCIPATIPLALPDNLVGPCSGCGRALQWRPRAPKKPPRVCFDCARLRANPH